MDSILPVLKRSLFFLFESKISLSLYESIKKVDSSFNFLSKNDNIEEGNFVVSKDNDNSLLITVKDESNSLLETGNFQVKTLNIKGYIRLYSEWSENCLLKKLFDKRFNTTVSCISASEFYTRIKFKDSDQIKKIAAGSENFVSCCCCFARSFDCCPGWSRKSNCHCENHIHGYAGYDLIELKELTDIISRQIKILGTEGLKLEDFISSQINSHPS